MRFRREIKKWVPCLLLAAFLLESWQVPVSADASVKKGSCGETAEFTIDKDCTLTITGTGKVDKAFADDDNIKYIDRAIKVFTILKM